MDTRTALLDAAESACRQRGYDGFSYADLAAEVGIRKASIHHHFPTKADLVLALLDRYAENFIEKLNAIAASGDTAGGQLREFVKLYRAALSRGDTLCLCVSLSAGRDALSEPTLKLLTRFHKQRIDWLTALFERARKDASIEVLGEPADEAAACLALMEGAQLAARAARRVSLFDDATRRLLQRFS